MSPENLFPESAEAGAGGRNPLGVALANASLLGVGYLMLGRRRLAAATLTVTVVLVAILVYAARSFWFEVVVLVWWSAVTAHGLRLATRQPGPGRPRTPARQWLLATAVTVPVVLTLALIRIDAHAIDQSVAEARAQGDCARATSAADRLWAGHYLAGAPLTARIDRTGHVCALLEDTEKKLNLAAAGDIGALTTGYELLNRVLTEWPGHEAMVARVLDEFLALLPGPGDCADAAVTDWLRERAPSGPVLGRAADAVDRVAPTALVGCADTLLKIGEWAQARDRYRRLLELYPRHALADRARKGVTRATQLIELDQLRALLGPAPGSTQPAYCRTPRAYSGAVPYRSTRPNKALLLGDNSSTVQFPADWRAGDVAGAVLILCVGETEFGSAVETCTYESDRDHRLFDLTFRKRAIPVRVFEVRTARLILDTRVEVGGATCPAKMSTFGDPGPDHYVTTTESDVRAAFAPMIDP
ncbi:tol-pal system YbgF family protein [Nocardia testacea]|uniref:Tol-pal system YbgF family protein n=1 Tax=Nocardia testacea TaxID=248551 RepID=A0ABW7W563_9NOCA